MQDTFLAAWRHAATFEGRSAVRTWLFRICRRQALARLRGRAPALGVWVAQVLASTGVLHHTVATWVAVVWRTDAPVLVAAAALVTGTLLLAPRVPARAAVRYGRQPRRCAADHRTRGEPGPPESTTKRRDDDRADAPRDLSRRRRRVGRAGGGGAGHRRPGRPRELAGRAAGRPIAAPVDPTLEDGYVALMRHDTPVPG